MASTDQIRRESLDVGPFHWEYLLAGNGPEPLVAFHGFGQSAEDFKDFIEVLGDRYTLVCLDLYGHGGSRCDMRADEVRFDPAALKGTMNSLLEKHGWDKVSLLGYSMGGRICLGILECMPERIHRAFLLAPDGLTKNNWYRFVTSTPLGNKIFKRAIADPRLLFRVGKLLSKTGLVRRKLLSFAWENFDTEEKRKRVYEVWMFYRLILPTVEGVRRSVARLGVSMVFMIGRYDRILPAKDANRWVRCIGRLATQQTLDAGHQLLTRQVAEAVKSYSGRVE